MEKYINALSNSLLFKNLKDEEIKNALLCLKPSIMKYGKNEYILDQEDNVLSIGIIVKGAATIFREDYYGNRIIIATLEESDIFGEALAVIKKNAISSIITKEESIIIFIKTDKLLNSCSNHCLFHTKLINNLIYILAYKNVELNNKINHISNKLTKDKILSYLLTVKNINNKDKFKIPFNRQELADYLGVDRSALSLCLSKLKNEGIIDYYKNTFELK